VYLRVGLPEGPFWAAAVTTELEIFPLPFPYFPNLFNPTFFINAMPQLDLVLFATLLETLASITLFVALLATEGLLLAFLAFRSRRLLASGEGSRPTPAPFGFGGAHRGFWSTGVFPSLSPLWQ